MAHTIKQEVTFAQSQSKKRGGGRFREVTPRAPLARTLGAEESYIYVYVYV